MLSRKRTARFVIRRQAVAVLLIGVGAASTAKAELAAHSSSYIGFGYGFSPNAQYEGQGRKFDFENFDGSSVVVLRFKAGGKIRNRHLIGADLGAVLTTGEHYLMMSHAIATYTHYSRGGGFFVRTGVGEGNLSETTFRADGDRTHYSSWGAAFLFGLGYSFPIHGRFNISLNLDHEIQKYVRGRSDMDSASATQFHVSLDWY